MIWSVAPARVMAGQRLQCVVAVRSLLGIASLVHARACFVSFSVLGRVCSRVLAQASEFFAFSGPPCVAAMVACVRACFVVACIGGSLAQGPAVMNVRLSPAANSLPDLAEEIAGLDAARRSLEEAGLKALDEAFAQALGSAGPRIEEVVSQSSALAGVGGVSPSTFLSDGLLEGHADAPVRLRVEAVPPMSRVVKEQVAAMERVRASQEGGLLSQAVREMGLLVDVVLGELRAQLSVLQPRSRPQRGAAFLQSGAGGSIDVRFLPPAAPFPTVAGLVQAMEGRRAQSEDVLRKRVAELQLKLLQSLNEKVKAALRRGLGRS